MSVRQPHIVVVGSINMDLVVRCNRLPVPGETVLANSSAEICGGKGANQAVAAARVGGNVHMIGRIGDDGFGSSLLAGLKRERIHCDAVLETSGCSSGLAIVAVEEAGQNSIMVVSGANGRLSSEDLRRHRRWIEQADVLLLQLEIPTETVLQAIEIAQQAGVRVILDPAPVPATWDDAMLKVDLVCPNESEAAAICNFPVQNLDDAAVAVKELYNRGAKNVAVTLGSSGTLFFDGNEPLWLKPYPVTAIDTTAAGDAFAGALAVRWANGDSLVDAIQFANAAGAIAASRSGAQPSMGTYDEIEGLRKSQP